MRRYFPLAIIVALAFFLSALTVPMSFLAATMEARAEHGSIISALIRFIWGWGVDLTNDRYLSEPSAGLLMYAINFFIFYLVLRLAHFGYLLARKLV
jgi:hypothetical protein